MKNTSVEEVKEETMTEETAAEDAKKKKDKYKGLKHLSKKELVSLIKARDERIALRDVQFEETRNNLARETASNHSNRSWAIGMMVLSVILFVVMMLWAVKDAVKDMRQYTQFATVYKSVYGLNPDAADYEDWKDHKAYPFIMRDANDKMYDSGNRDNKLIEVPQIIPDREIVPGHYISYLNDSLSRIFIMSIYPVNENGENRVEIYSYYGYGVDKVPLFYTFNIRINDDYSSAISIDNNIVISFEDDRPWYNVKFITFPDGINSLSELNFAGKYYKIQNGIWEASTN